MAFVWLFAWGWSYYRIPVRARPFHEDDALLRPSGRVGLLCAIAGTALMVLNLSYLLRKRLASVEWLGALRGWMSFHVLTGLVGPTLILFHAGFAPRSAVGILSFGAMLVVVGTGLMGRYLYALVPRSIEGRELEVEEVRQGLLEKQSQLLKLGVDLETFSLPESQSRGSGGTLGSILRVVLADGVARRDIRAARRAVRKRGLKPQEQQLLPLLRRFARERQGLARYQELRRIMGAWRFLHRWLAVLMFLVVMFHVAIAVRFGDLWILGGRD